MNPLATQVTFNTPRSTRLNRYFFPQKLRHRNRMMAHAAQDMGRQYRMALGGERWAAFSIIGAKDWEDYASLAVQVMQLETQTDIEARLERLESHMERIEELLETVVRSNGEQPPADPEVVGGRLPAS